MRSEKSLILKSVAMIAICVFPIAAFMKSSERHGSPEPVAGRQASNGRELFLNNCARCHGNDAKGDKGPDLTNPKRQSKWTSSDEPLINKINKGGLFMPKFSKRLTPEQIKSIADYVRTLGK